MKRIGMPRRSIGVITLLVMSVGSAVGGEFFESEGLALRGHDPVAYFDRNRPLRGLPEHSVVFRGSTFRFVSRANRDAFAADPTRYAPRYGGFCAYGVAHGYKAETDPAAFSIVDGRLYLNYNGEVRELWQADIPGAVAAGDRNWPTVSSQHKVYR